MEEVSEVAYPINWRSYNPSDPNYAAQKAAVRKIMDKDSF
jgi:hypothetical protein